MSDHANAVRNWVTAHAVSGQPDADGSPPSVKEQADWAERSVNALQQASHVDLGAVASAVRVPSHDGAEWCVMRGPERALYDAIIERSDSQLRGIAWSILASAVAAECGSRTSSSPKSRERASDRARRAEDRIVRCAALRARQDGSRDPPDRRHLAKVKSALIEAAVAAPSHLAAVLPHAPGGTAGFWIAAMGAYLPGTPAPGTASDRPILVNSRSPGLLLPQEHFGALTDDLSAESQLELVHRLPPGALSLDLAVPDLTSGDIDTLPRFELWSTLVEDDLLPRLSALARADPEDPLRWERAADRIRGVSSRTPLRKLYLDSGILAGLRRTAGGSGSPVSYLARDAGVATGAALDARVELARHYLIPDLAGAIEILVIPESGWTSDRYSLQRYTIVPSTSSDVGSVCWMPTRSSSDSRISSGAAVSAFMLRASAVAADFRRAVPASLEATWTGLSIKPAVVFESLLQVNRGVCRSLGLGEPEIENVRKGLLEARAMATAITPTTSARLLKDGLAAATT